MHNKKNLLNNRHIYGHIAILILNILIIISIISIFINISTKIIILLKQLFKFTCFDIILGNCYFNICVFNFIYNIVSSTL